MVRRENSQLHSPLRSGCMNPETAETRICIPLHRSKFRKFVIFRQTFCNFFPAKLCGF
jgi:hypothetical protein